VQQVPPRRENTRWRDQVLHESVIELCESDPREKLPRLRDSDDSSIVDLKTQRIIYDSELGGYLKPYRATA